MITNQSHKITQKGYFEWWYFHFTSTQLGAINMVLHETDIFGLNHVPYISVSLMLNSGINRYFSRNLNSSEIIRQDDGIYLRVENGIFDEGKQNLNFRVNIDNLRFSGHIRKLVSPGVIKNGILFKDDNSNQKNYWIVQIPYGKFNAKLELDDISYSLDGFAYHDHNWGTAPIQNHFKEWIWGNFGDSQGTVTCYRIKTRNDDIIDRVVLISKQKVLTATRLDTSLLNELSLLQDPEKVNLNTVVIFPEFERKLTMQVNQKNLMRKRLSESHADFNATYCRWFATGELNVTIENRALSGLTEYLCIKK